MNEQAMKDQTSAMFRDYLREEGLDLSDPLVRQTAISTARYLHDLATRIGTIDQTYYMARGLRSSLETT